MAQEAAAPEVLADEIQPPAEVRKAAKLLDAAEEEAKAVAESFCSLLSSIREALSEVSSVSVDHMKCYSDATADLQSASIEAASRGNKFVNSCLRLNEEMKEMNSVALKLKALRQAVDHLDNLTKRYLP